MMTTTNLLKQYNTQLNNIKDEIRSLEQVNKQTSARIKLLSTQAKDIKHNINNLSNKEIIITEHAILRYIERILKVDINDVKSNILTDEVKKQIEFLNGTRGKIHNNGSILVIENNKIITVED
jgi:predicted nuclease with TOPRIM domain